MVLCVGGNDFALRGVTDPTEILGRVRQILNFYKAMNVKPERMFYFTAYPPTDMMVAGML